jgi:hypothetical protein
MPLLIKRSEIDHALAIDRAVVSVPIERPLGKAPASQVARYPERYPEKNLATDWASELPLSH